MPESVKFDIHFDIHETRNVDIKRASTVATGGTLPSTTATGGAPSRRPRKAKRTLPETGGAPLDLEEVAEFHQEKRGGIFGGPVEPAVIGFSGKAKNITGGVKPSSAYRDERSKQAVVLEKYYIKLERLESRLAMLEHGGIRSMLQQANVVEKMNKVQEIAEQGTDYLEQGAHAIRDPVGFGMRMGQGLLHKASMPKPKSEINKNAISKSAQVTATPTLPTNVNQQRNVARTVMSMASGAGPYGLAFVGAVSAIAAAPETVAKIIKTLGQKGLPLNLDWRRMIEEETNALFDIEEKRRRLLGDDSFIYTQSNRYQADTGSPTFNSLENRVEIRTATAGNRSKALGID